MDFEALRANLRAVDWKKWAKMFGTVLLWLVGISIALSILAGIFVGIPMAAFGLLSALYEYLSTREHKYYYAAVFIVVLIVVMIVFRRVGLVSLSSQSLAHRRNLFFAFFLVFLIENFDLDVARMFKAEENDLLNAATKGILALFALYSFIEYVHNFLYDFLRSRNDSKIIDSPNFFRAPKLVDIWLVLIGNYRVFFDIALPLATSAFILLIYSSDVNTVFGIGKEYVSREISRYIEDPENEEIQSLLEQATVEIDTAVKNIEEVGKEAQGVTGDVYKNLKEEFNRPSNGENAP